MLSVKRIHAGRGAVDYYVGRVRTGIGEYYLADHTGDDAVLAVPPSGWWGGSTDALGLVGEIDRPAFAIMYGKGLRPDGERLGRPFRLPEQVQRSKEEALRTAAAIVDPEERERAEFDVRRRSWQPSVAAWDCTFSPVKSVSLLWAASDHHVRAQVWAAHTAAVDAGLAYLEEHGSYVRAGHGGVRVLDTDGFVAARFNEWTSRSGDMQLHTHCVVLNRARTVEDGKWRALDGRGLLAARAGAGAVYARTVEVELTRRLGVGWRDRPDGLREIDGVDDDLIEAFSTRRHAITVEVERMADEWERRHGHRPPQAVLSSMAQQATLATRPNKRELPADAAVDQWQVTARQLGRRLDALPRRVLSRTTVGPAGTPSASDTAAVLSRLADSGKATFTRHEVLRAALDTLPGLASDPTVRPRAERLTDLVLGTAEVVRVSADDPLGIVGPEHVRADGTSVYDPPHRHRWALAKTIQQERWLLDIAPEPTGHVIDDTTITRASLTHQLGPDQADAIADLLGTDRRIGLLVGPAGAGKTRTLRAVADAWQQHSGGEIIGLTVSQSAAEVLASETGIATQNTAKWLWETAAGRWNLPDGALLLIDEASMVSTDQLVALVEQARRASGRVLLIGDPAQLSAVHIGGGFDLLADAHGAAHLTEIRRFANEWEREASVQLRGRDINGLAEYASHGRIHSGPTTQVEAEMFAAWQRDALVIEGDDPRTVLMVVATNEQAAVLSERARRTRIDAGLVVAGRTVRLRDNVASVGDHIVTRRNDRRITTDREGFVVNGDVWTLETVHPTGAATARRHSDGATVRLPAAYLRDHTHLGYATTAHRAQGMTVDVCHAAITPDLTHELLYVGATRGRHANHLWVATDADHDTLRDRDDLPDPEAILARILQRQDPDRRSAHHVTADSSTDMHDSRRQRLVETDALERRTGAWLDEWATANGLDDIVGAAERGTLVATLAEAALSDHDAVEQLAAIATARPLDDARSTAAVLNWRLNRRDPQGASRDVREPASVADPTTASAPRRTRSPAPPR